MKKDGTLFKYEEEQYFYYDKYCIEGFRIAQKAREKAHPDEIINGFLEGLDSLLDTTPICKADVRKYLNGWMKKFQIKRSDLR